MIITNIVIIELYK